MGQAARLGLSLLVLMGACVESTEVDGGTADGGCDYGGKHHDVGDSFESTDGCNSCSCTQDGVTCTARACVDAGLLDAAVTLQYYATCGAPVCGPGTDGPTGAPVCTTETTGESCTDEGTLCDPGLGCGINLVCAASDPAQSPGGCPISRARYKTDIHYLGEAERRSLHDALVAMPLARWRYRGDVAAQEHVGFVIEDVEPSPSVRGDQVDLYGYTSMTVAALQVEARRVKALERELDQMRARLQKLEQRCAR